MGTYIGARLTSATISRLQEWAVTNNISPMDEYHISYHRTEDAVNPPATDIYPHTISNVRNPIFIRSADDLLLVIDFNDPVVKRRVQDFGGRMKKGHVTLSYDITRRHTLTPIDFSIDIEEEFVSPLVGPTEARAVMKRTNGRIEDAQPI